MTMFSQINLVMDGHSPRRNRNGRLILLFLAAYLSSHTLSHTVIYSFFILINPYVALPSTMQLYPSQIKKDPKTTLISIHLTVESLLQMGIISHMDGQLEWCWQP